MQPKNINHSDRHFPAFHVVAKPVGSLCNLDCAYCFYLEKEKLYAGQSFRMQDQVLERFIQQYIAAQETDEVHFLWQGGEPMLLGLDYFRRVVELQDKHASGKTIHNAIQTNGLFIDEAWCGFLKERGFLVGVSIDGPAELHDPFRVSKGGEPTHHKVVAGIELLRQHEVSFNTLTAVHSLNDSHANDVYAFLKEIGSLHLQFLPVVERWVQGSADLASPASDSASTVTPWTVGAAAYGDFLIEIFDQWVAGDVGRVFIQQFEVAIESWLGREPSLCLFRRNCGNALAVERNGDIYACDHFVFEDYRRGNIVESDLLPIVESPDQREFGEAKSASLPRQCLKCDVLFACQGECPKNRFTETEDGEPGLNYLCPSYLRFFRHIDPTMRRIVEQLRSQGV